MLGLSNERDRKLISVRTNAWDLSTRFSKVTLFTISQLAICSQQNSQKYINIKYKNYYRTLNYITLCIRRHERKGEISWSLIAPKKHNASKFVLNQKQERKWALELVCYKCSPRGCSRPFLSPPQRLLLVNTSERKKREAGALERENGSAGNALIFPSSQPLRVSTQRDCRRPLRRRERPSCKLSLALGFCSHRFRSFYLPLAPTICPWVSEDGQQLIGVHILHVKSLFIVFSFAFACPFLVSSISNSGHKICVSEDGCCHAWEMYAILIWKKNHSAVTLRNSK